MTIALREKVARRENLRPGDRRPRTNREERKTNRPASAPRHEARAEKKAAKRQRRDRVTDLAGTQGIRVYVASEIAAMMRG